jgi:hypothetical protein
MTYTIEREDAAEDLRVLRAAITVASGFVDGDADAMKRLRALADQIEEQVHPAIEEPRSFGSVVRVVYPPSAELRFCRTYSVDVDKPWCSGNHLRSWADVVEGATDAEVLRVGIGEPEPTAAEVEQVIRDVTEKARGDHDIAELTAREVVGRLIQRLPATMFRTRDVDIEPEPVRVRRFCSLRRDCRMADGHSGGCQP